MSTDTKPKQTHRYCKRNECINIQWVETHMRDGESVCPSCGTPAESCLTFFGFPGWKHKQPRSAAQ